MKRQPIRQFYKSNSLLSHMKPQDSPKIDSEALASEIALIKQAVFDDEQELTDAAKVELEQARNTPESEYVSLGKTI